MNRVAGGALFALAVSHASIALGCGASSNQAALVSPAQSCNAPAPSYKGDPATESGAWRGAREKLGALRQSLGGKTPHTLRLAVKLREPFTGRVMDARGAVALSPPTALRMILLGPGGTTALDLWANEDRFRFAVPALDLLRRGDKATPREQKRGLPVDFLRWWLLRPAYGALLWHKRGQTGDRYVLRDGSALVDLCALDDGGVVATRTSWSSDPSNTDGKPRLAQDVPRKLDEETIFATRRGCGPVSYIQASTGLSISVECEGEETSRAPNPRAFVDPDEPERGESDDGGGG